MRFSIITATTEIGASAIMVSNHGDRQLDGSRSPFASLAAILDEVGGEIEVILDGGVRRRVGQGADLAGADRRAGTDPSHCRRCATHRWPRRRSRRREARSSAIEYDWSGRQARAIGYSSM